MCSAGPLPSRRAVLRGVLVGLACPLVACTGQPREPAPPEPVPPDVVAADRAADRERRLLAAYDAALLIAPQLAERLLPLRGEHAAHLDALGRPEVEQTAEPDPTAQTGPAAGSGQDAEAGQDAAPGPTPPPAAPAPVLPPDPAELLAALADLERRAGIAHASAAVRGGRGVAAVLASLAASEAAHAVALT
jgi:hypothetical protein